MPMRYYMWGAAALAIIALLAVTVLFGLAAWSRRASGPRSKPASNRLKECSAAPNCVCSQSSREARAVAPFAFRGDAAASIQHLIAVLQSLPVATIVSREPAYLHVEFRSSFFGFVDDVEFLVDDAAEVIHVRSASRIGYGDAGANRRRVEMLRSLYADQR